MKNWILALLAALCAAVGVATLRAAAQSVMTGPRTPPAPPSRGPAVCAARDGGAGEPGACRSGARQSTAGQPGADHSGTKKSGTSPCGAQSCKRDPR